MREILFRGKRMDTGEWVYGWYCPYPFGIWPLKCAIVPSIEAERGSHSYVEVDANTVGQYTGLKDVSGKYIFEGDVVRLLCSVDPEDRICTVTWDDETARFGLYNPLFVGDFLRYDSKDIVVIGNIHDNPDLLEEETP